MLRRAGGCHQPAADDDADAPSAAADAADAAAPATAAVGEAAARRPAALAAPLHGVPSQLLRFQLDGDP
jgi:hypothetical protein